MKIELFKKFKNIKIEFIIYTVIILILSSRWINDEFPLGLDIMGGFEIFRYIGDIYLSQGFLPSWSPYWFFGHPIWYTLPVLVFSPFSDNIFLYKLVYITIFILSGISIYKLSIVFTGDRIASFVVGLIYMLIPYHVLAVVHVGIGSLNIIFALLPFTILIIEKTFIYPNMRNSILIGFCTAAVILAHPQAFPILVGPFLIIYILFRYFIIDKSKNCKNNSNIFIIGGLILGLLLSAYWWLPYMEDRLFMQSVSFSIEDTKYFTPTIIEILTLNPALPTSIRATNINLVSIIIPMLAILGTILSWRNKYVVLFALSGIISVVLAMGVLSPIFPFIFEYIPFFGAIRTPGRFLIYGSLSFALLAGFGVKELIKRLQIIGKFLVMISIILIVINTGTDIYKGFNTFKLKDDQKHAMEWLATRGDVSTIVFPRDVRIHIDDQYSAINPWYYFHLTNMKTFRGGIDFYRPINTNYWSSDTDIDISAIAGINYILFDYNIIRYLDNSSRKTVNQIYNRVNTTTTFEQVWKKDAITIFQNLNAFPKIYSYRYISKEDMPIFDKQAVYQWKKYGGPSTIKIDSNLDNGDSFLELTVNFTSMQKDYVIIGTIYSNDNASDIDSIRLWYYLPKFEKNIRLSIGFVTEEGIFWAPIKIKEGQDWQYIDIPLIILQKPKRNASFDMTKTKKILIGITETNEYNNEKNFKIYLKNMTINRIKYSFNDIYIKYTNIEKYDISMDIDKRSYIVIAQSYHPNWIIRDIDTNNIISSEPTYIGYTSFLVDKGKHRLSITYEKSILQKVGFIVSLLALVICIGYLILLHYRRNDKK